MTDNVLLALRRLANDLAPILGRLPAAVLRRMTRHVSSRVRVGDFDGWATLDLQLNEHMQRRIFWMGYYSCGIVRALDRLLKPGMVVVDAGANIGELSLVAASRVGDAGQVYAFEPVEALHRTLVHHIAINGLGNVRAVQLALGDQSSSQRPIYADCGQGGQELHLGLGSLLPGDGQARMVGIVQVETLDNWVAGNGLDRLDLIKIDVEGAEMALLSGAGQVIVQFRPMIIIEIQDHTAGQAGYRGRDVFNLLRELGYGLQRIGDEGQLEPLDSADMLYAYQNVLCLPVATPLPQ